MRTILLGLIFVVVTVEEAASNEVPLWRKAKSKLVPNFTADEGTLPCRDSGMCSVGHVTHWTGDVYPLQGLKDCLHARSYKRELILVAETRLTAGFQTYWNALSVGYGHVVLMATAEQCARAAEVWPELSCIWSSQVFAGGIKFLLDRHAFLPRAARLGFNVLMMDSDSFFLRDVYSQFKSPPLRDAQLIVLRDPHIGWLNSAVIYSQNTRPDGPAVYLMAEVIDRNERWGEDAEALRARGLPTGCWEQMTMSDCLLTTIIGRPIALGCWNNVHNETYMLAWEGAHKELFGYKADGHGLGVWDYLEERRVPWPRSLVEHAPAFELEHSVVWMQVIQVPNTQGQWPKEIGGPLYSPQRGPRSRAWMELLKSDGWPLWPDPEDPTQAAAAASNTELFSFLPDWLGVAFTQQGASGWWNPHLLGPEGRSPYALVHIYHPPGGGHNKLTVKMANGAWNWDLVHRLRPHGGVFFASTAHTPVPDVLAYTPEVEARDWASFEEWDAATMALTRLAMEMGRAVAYPAPRCNVSWLGGARNNKMPLDVPPEKRFWTIPTVRTNASGSPGPEGAFAALRCMHGGYLMQGCLAVRWYFSGGLLAPEYDHFLAHFIHGKGEPVEVVPIGSLSPPGSAGSGSGSSPGSSTTTTSGGAAWYVLDLAQRLMDAHGGPGSGLLHPRLLERGGEAARATVAAAAAGQGRRPRLLLVPEVPVLSEQLGPRHVLYREHEHEDFDKCSCPWVQGKPFR